MVFTLHFSQDCCGLLSPGAEINQNSDISLTFEELWQYKNKCSDNWLKFLYHRARETTFNMQYKPSILWQNSRPCDLCKESQTVINSYDLISAELLTRNIHGAFQCRKVSRLQSRTWSNYGGQEVKVTACHVLKTVMCFSQKRTQPGFRPIQSLDQRGVQTQIFWGFRAENFLRLNLYLEPVQSLKCQMLNILRKSQVKQSFLIFWKDFLYKTEMTTFAS